VTLHLAPNAPWLLLAVALVVAVVLSVWAYRIAIPPLPLSAKRLLPALRALALVLLLLLLAQPVLERAIAGRPRLVVLVDRSLSMDLPVGVRGESRAAVAERAVKAVDRSWGSRAQVVTLPFAARLATDSSRVGATSSTALGDALGELADSPLAESATGVVVVSDGATNKGGDPVAAARALGVPVHALLVGDPHAIDRAVVDLESPTDAQVGRSVAVRVHATTSEPRGTPLGVSLRDGERELAHATVISPGPGAEVTAELRGTPLRPGLAVWTAAVDSAAGELTAHNNAMQTAFPVAPGRLGVTLVSGGLNWDFTFLRRALAADSSLALHTWVRERSGWRSYESKRGGAPTEADLRDEALLVLDGITPSEVAPAFDAAVAGFLERGGGVLLFGGSSPGLARYRGTRLGTLLGLQVAPGPLRSASPSPVPEARDLLEWDDDPARGDRAWRAAAPLGDVVPLAPGGGDRVLVRAATSDGTPLLVARRAGRGQALLVNGTGVWRWALSGTDELTAERGRKLWRNFAHWLAEPVQAEPLRVRPERWITERGSPVRLLATLQDESFKPVSGADVTAEIAGRARCAAARAHGRGQQRQLHGGGRRSRAGPLSRVGERDTRRPHARPRDVRVRGRPLEPRGVARTARQRDARRGRPGVGRASGRGGPARCLAPHARHPRRGAHAHDVGAAVGVARAVHGDRRRAQRRVVVAPETRPALTRRRQRALSARRRGATSEAYR
jgi:hypothetical protein